MNGHDVSDWWCPQSRSRIQHSVYTKSRQVKCVDEKTEISVVAGSGQTGRNMDPVWHHPLPNHQVLLQKVKHCMFVILVNHQFWWSPRKGMVKFLTAVGDLYDCFKVYTEVGCTLPESLNKLKNVDDFFSKASQNVMASYKLTEDVQGPQGCVSSVSG
ncbi:unnamed protein product [Mytilus coruscus]|uniref:Uncharacterized protein n=1 Tax=Mytilus coruscus TaxID=42192 RepID=A0A6J8CZJ6_MYTCO|nr:unnamed protein product [Mytilus coruscus]